MSTPLEHIQGVDAVTAQRLLNQWITTAEQLVGLGVHERFGGFLAERLGITSEALETLLTNARQVALLPAMQTGHLNMAHYGRGLTLSHPQLAMRGGNDPDAPENLMRCAESPDLPPKVNHALSMSPVRDQGTRGTCVAFTSCAMREFHLSSSADLSEQFFFWACKQRDHAPEDEGTTFISAARAMQEAGTCPENVWPYISTPDADANAETPPSGAEEEAAKFCWPTAGQLALQLDTIKRILAGADGIPAQPVGIGVLVFESSFFSSDVARSGRITLPFRNEPNVGGHALCVVGYQDDTSVPGGGYLIIRNSWGERWGVQCEYGAGYGLMPYTYLRLYGVDGISLASTNVALSEASFLQQPNQKDFGATNMLKEENIFPDIRVDRETEDASLPIRPEEYASLEEYLHGASAAMLAILFCDIENYSQSTERLGDERMAKIRQYFQNVTRRITERDGRGWVIKNMGDAFLCVFPEPFQAVARALEMQEEFSRFTLEDDQPDNRGIVSSQDRSLRVRIGIHLGQALVENQVHLDIFGRNVNLAVRVMGLAAGGQIYTTRAVYEGAHETLAQIGNSAMRWENHGRFTVKGFSDGEEIFEVFDSNVSRMPCSPLSGQHASALDCLQHPNTSISQPVQCAACGKTFLSKLSLSSQCHECGAPVCHVCSASMRGSVHCAKHGGNYHYLVRLR
ncbi:TPA: hypothetical protein DDW35_05670, partial [Candidatus Sumerlaeota bacterium]|nr:hypothetical protein [Candidatus Sumerlaeota bacterium]